MRDENSSKRPAPDGFGSWPEYWKARGMPWRTEQEIDKERKEFLADRRAVKVDMKRGIYPFRTENEGRIKLTRADVEWLLETHESGGKGGPVLWRDVDGHWYQPGMYDLLQLIGPSPWEDSNEEAKSGPPVGLDLRGADLNGVNLSDLPLAYLRGALSLDAWTRATQEQAEAAAVQLQEANLAKALLQGATLAGAHLEGANVFKAQLQWAILIEVHLEGTDLSEAHLEGTDLRLAFLDQATIPNGLILGAKAQGIIRLADVRWNGVNLAVVEWKSVSVLGDEQAAREATVVLGTKSLSRTAKVQKAKVRLEAFREATRANRQVASVLRQQGMQEEGDRFAYRAQVLQRQVLRRERRYGAWSFSCLLMALAGYGYRLWRILAAYGAVLVVFTIVYWLVGVHSPGDSGIHALWDSALVSLSAIHGRATFESLQPWSAAAWVSAIESVIGIIIEGVFVAMLVQRFFAR